MGSKTREKCFKCNECSAAFTAPCRLKEHKSSVHSELRPFQCEHCDYSAKLKSALQRHYATHFPQTYKTQSCLQCPYKCSIPARLLAHLRVHTKEKPFACKMCSYRASIRSSLTVHTRTHTGEKPFKCSLCTLAFSERSNLKRHIKLVHNKDEVSLMPCSFPGCDRKFANICAVRIHVKSFHNKERRFFCPHCQEMFYEKHMCVNHILRRHTSNKPYKCSVCEYASASFGSVRRHENTKHGEYQDVDCPDCHKKYKNVQSLAAHQLNSHSNAKESKELAPQWKCKEPGCTKEYESRHNLKRHVNSFHLQQKPFKCLYCDHTTATSQNLNTHLKTHLQEKPYSCNQCKRCFISSSGLSTHNATAHSDLRPFQCELCIYRTNTKAHLKHHQKKHKPMPTTSECDICKGSRCCKKRTNYSFRTNCCLNSRMRKTHSYEGSFKRSHSSPGAKTKGSAVPNTEPRYTTGFHSTGDFPPCFVRLVRKTEINGDLLSETAITIYA